MNRHYIMFYNPVTRKRQRVARTTQLGRVAASGDKKALKALCLEIERQAAIYRLTSDRYAQQDALDKGAERRGNTLRWANVFSPRFYI